MLLESEQKDQLYTALAQAQVEFPTIRVNRKAFKNEYADLYAILKPIYPILSKYGLSIRPWGGMINNEQWIGARIMHKSGQYETNIFKFEQDAVKNPNDQYTHKKQGALTYFNRNHIKDMLGVLISDDPEDDDGQSHLAHHESSHTIELISDKEYDALMKKLEGHANITKDLLFYCKKKYEGFSSLRDIPQADYYSICESIEKKKQQYRELDKKPENIINV
jgi:hypothetical protein